MSITDNDKKTTTTNLRIPTNCQPRKWNREWNWALHCFCFFIYRKIWFTWNAVCRRMAQILWRRMRKSLNNFSFIYFRKTLHFWIKIFWLRFHRIPKLQVILSCIKIRLTLNVCGLVLLRCLIWCLSARLMLYFSNVWILASSEWW